MRLLKLLTISCLVLGHWQRPQVLLRSLQNLLSSARDPRQLEYSVVVWVLLWHSLHVEGERVQHQLVLNFVQNLDTLHKEYPLFCFDEGVAVVLLCTLSKENI